MENQALRVRSRYACVLQVDESVESLRKDCSALVTHVERLRSARSTTTRVNRQLGISRTSGGGRLSSVDFYGRSKTTTVQEPGNAFVHSQCRRWTHKSSFSPLPCFTGGKDKDVVPWMHRYERIGRYNHCGEDALRKRVDVALVRRGLVIHLQRSGGTTG